MRAVILVAVVVSVFCATACGQSQEFVGEGGIYAFAMTEDSPPYLVVEEAELYMVETRVELPIVPPTDQEMAGLEGSAAEPFARMPWVRHGDMAIELDIALTNLSEDARTVTMTVNGINEFHEFMPSFEVDNEEIIPGFSQWERTMVVGGNETHRRTIREEELDEVAVDLATVVNGAPNANQIVYFANHSSIDERAQPYIPGVIPGLTGLRLGIRSGGAGAFVMEAAVRVRDISGDRLQDDDEEPWELPVPEVFTPAGYGDEEEE